MAIDGIIGVETKTVIIPQEDTGAPDYTLAIELDCVTNEAPLNEAEPTELPVEDDANITDHIKVRPTGLNLSVIHSEQSLDIAEPLPDPERARGLYETLLGWQQDKVLVVVLTPHRVYRNMAITGIPPVWDATNTKSFMATLSFREIRRVSTQIVELSTPAPKAKKKRGSKNTKEPKPEVKKSAVKVLSDWVGGG